MMQEDGDSNSMMVKFQAVYNSMIAELERLEQEKKNQLIQSQSSLRELSTNLAQKTHYFEALIRDKDRRINQLQELTKKLQSQDSDKNRRQVRRYIQCNNQKEAEINSLKRHINTLKNKINSMETQISNVTNTKEDLELFIVKGIEQIRCINKEINNNIEETDTEKMVMESKYKQINQKTNMIIHKIGDLQIKFRNSEEGYSRMKILYKQSKDQSLNQKFDIEELKEQIRILKLNQNNENKIYQTGNYLRQQADAIVQLGNILIERQNFLNQVGNYHIMNVSLLEENMALKKKITEIEQELNQLKSEYVNGYQDELLGKRDPSLFQYLLKKKNELVHFQQSIEKIESYIENTDETINRLLRQFEDKKMQCFCGKQAQLAKLQYELANYQSEIARLQSEIFNLQSENASIHASKLNLKEQIDSLMKKNEQCLEASNRLKKDQSNHDKIIQAYKAEIRQILCNQMKGRKKKPMKKRCLNCLISIEKGDHTGSCDDCKKSYHQHCVQEHDCEKYKLDDGLSYLSSYQ